MGEGGKGWVKNGGRGELLDVKGCAEWFTTGKAWWFMLKLKVVRKEEEAGGKLLLKDIKRRPGLESPIIITFFLFSSFY